MGSVVVAVDLEGEVHLADGSYLCPFPRPINSVHFSGTGIINSIFIDNDFLIMLLSFALHTHRILSTETNLAQCFIAHS